MQDSLGDRMKEQYENRTRYSLPRRTYTIIRVDGKAFHTFTRGCKKPFDTHLMNAMNCAALKLCDNLQGAKFAYVQSDEISILLTDFDDIMTQAWFKGNLQKMASVSASIATAYFNNYYESEHMALFDSRVFTIPDPVEVYNYFVWRQKDATRNSLQLVAQSLYSQKQLHGKNQADLQEMIFEKGQNWNDYPVGCKRGRIAKRLNTGLWAIDEPPIFTQEKEYLQQLIPMVEAW